MLSMGKKEKKKDKAALAVAARQEQKDKERERIRQRMKERMREADEPEAESSVMRAPTPSELSAHSSSNDTDSGDDKNEQKGGEKKERISEGEEEEDSSSVGVSPLKSQAKNEDGEAGVTWGSNPAPPVSPRAPPRRKSLPLAQTRDPRDTKGSPKKGAQDTIEKLLERSSGPGSGRGHSALDAARGLDGSNSGRNSARDRGRTPSPMRERPKPKKKEKVSPRDEEKDQADFLAESLLREGTGKNIDQMAEIGWY